MNPQIHFLICLMTAAFVVGSVGYALSIPVVAFKIAAVLFEADPASDDASAE
jgi:hypothetical protein